MPAFYEIALPHRDILEGRFSLDAYAGDLWEVVKGSAPLEYRDAEIFFSRTYETRGLREVVDLAERRLKGESVDHIIQLQTPFGGGKTHTLIYLYHKAKARGTNLFVFCGNRFSPSDTTLWEEMERQLTGRTEIFSGKIPPGGEKLKAFLSRFEPLLILLDEIHKYVTEASAIRVEETSLASLTLTFLQTLTNIVKTLPRTAMFISLPSSSPYGDQKSEELLNNLKRITGRVERVVTPVVDEEVAEVIKRRLFSGIDLEKAKKVVSDFVNYAERENILPPEMDKTAYRERFLKSYPFQPEVIDVLYHRWGSFPTFQRTRGVLRLLALVVNSAIRKRVPFIRLSDFDLNRESIREELIKHIGQEFESIIAQDITSETSGARKVDKMLGDSYRPYRFGTKTATAIFMYSFTGAGSKGATLQEIKLACAEPPHSSSIIVEAIEKLRENLFYLSEDGLYFKNRPNLNKVLLDRMESLLPHELEQEERTLLEQNLRGSPLKVYLWPQHTRDIPDTREIKLVVLKRENGLKEFSETCGERPRIYRNVLIFLMPDEEERSSFERELRKLLAWKQIAQDSRLALTEEQKKEIKERQKRAEEDINLHLRNLYRRVLIPWKDGFKQIDLGVMSYGKDRKLAQEVFEMLQLDQELVKTLMPAVIINKYMKDKNYVRTADILEALFRVPGEIRILNENVLRDCLRTGVKEALFGLGELKGDEIIPSSIAEDVDITFNENEIILERNYFLTLKAQERYRYTSQPTPTSPTIKDSPVNTTISPKPQIPSQPQDSIILSEGISSLSIEVVVPQGRFSALTNVINMIFSKFESVEVRVKIRAEEGMISNFDYETKILEAFKQAGIEIVNITKN